MCLVGKCPVLLPEFLNTYAFNWFAKQRILASIGHFGGHELADLEFVSNTFIHLYDASLVGVGEAGELAVLAPSLVQHQEVVPAEFLSLLLQLEPLEERDHLL